MFYTPFLAVVVSAILLKNSHQLSFPDFPEERISPPLCSATTNGQISCINCGASALCLLSNGLPNPYISTCSGSTPVCGLDTSSPPKYACVASNVDCQCPGTPGLSYKPDPFNSHYYTVCSGTDRILVNCGEYYYNPQKNDCSGTAPPGPEPNVCTGLGAGAFEDSDTTTCDGYIYCSSSGEILSSGKCSPPTNYFNPETNSCANPIPPFSCQSSYLGYYGDPFDCKRYYVCSGTTLIGVECCPTGQQFDINSVPCTTTAVCNALPQCARAATTTTTSTPSTTTSTSTPSTTTSTTTPTTTSTSTPSTTTSTSTPSTTTSTTTPTTTTSTSTPSTTTSTSTPSTTTTTLSSGCTSQANFRCPAPDGYYAQCNYCARTYFQCVSGTATLRTCSGNLLFNTVPSYPACLSNCPYYP